MLYNFVFYFSVTVVRLWIIAQFAMQKIEVSVVDFWCKSSLREFLWAFYLSDHWTNRRLLLCKVHFSPYVIKWPKTKLFFFVHYESKWCDCYALRVRVTHWSELFVTHTWSMVGSRAQGSPSLPFLRAWRIGIRLVWETSSTDFMHR